MKAPSRKNKSSAISTSALIGLLFGLPIPIVTVFLDITARGLEPSWQNILFVFSERSIHWIFLIHPIAFAIVFGFAGAMRWNADQKNLQLLDLLEKQARTDGLTGLLNHAAIYELLGHELARWQREREKKNMEPVSLAMFDLDHFKKVNDTHGHQVGDNVLIRTAQLMLEETRKYDFAGRYGGEEFVVLMPRTNLKEAQSIAERIRSRIERELFAENVRITISGGVAEAMPSEEAEEVLERADQALYAAKQAGRNRIELKTTAGE